MSAILRAPAELESGTRPTWATGAAATLQRWWLVYAKWRLQQLAIARLRAMSDRQLSDIGIARSEIDCAARHGSGRDRVLSLCGLALCVVGLGLGLRF